MCRHQHGCSFLRTFSKQIFDGAITAGSFAIDVVLMEGVSVAEGEETLALMVVFLLWRVLRLANSESHCYSRCNTSMPRLI
jgi:hypothetical protein